MHLNAYIKLKNICRYFQKKLFLSFKPRDTMIKILRNCLKVIITILISFQLPYININNFPGVFISESLHEFGTEI